MTKTLNIKEQQLEAVKQELDRNIKLFEALSSCKTENQVLKEIITIRLQSLSRIAAEYRQTIKFIEKL